MSDSHDRGAGEAPAWENWNVNGRDLRLGDLDKGLLKFCLEHGFKGQETKIPQRNKEDFEWLQKVWNDLEDDAKVMLRHINTCRDEKSSDDDKAEAWEEVAFYIEDINNANDFCKLGGVGVLVHHLTASSADLRAAACAIVPKLAANNPPGKVALANAGAVPVLSGLIKNEKETGVLVRVLSAWSSMLPNNKPVSDFFFSNCLARLLEILKTSTEAPVVMRCAVILRHLVEEPEPKIDQLLSMQITQLLIGAFERLNPEKNRERCGAACEQVLTTLCAVSKHPNGAKTLHSEAAFLQRCKALAAERSEQLQTLADAAKELTGHL